jgi:hypothetical protein
MKKENKPQETVVFERHIEKIYTTGFREPIALRDVKTGEIFAKNKAGMKKLDENMRMIAGMFDD